MSADGLRFTESLRTSQTDPMRLEDGKLTTETFEGDVDRTLYNRMMGDAQHHFLNQAAPFAKFPTWLLPSSHDPRSGRD